MKRAWKGRVLQNVKGSAFILDWGFLKINISRNKRIFIKNPKDIKETEEESKASSPEEWSSKTNYTEQPVNELFD